jgi:hypothetical protein
MSHIPRSRTTSPQAPPQGPARLSRRTRGGAGLAPRQAAGAQGTAGGLEPPPISGWPAGLGDNNTSGFASANAHRR